MPRVSRVRELEVRCQLLEAQLSAANDAYRQLATEALAQRREFGFTATAPDRTPSPPAPPPWSAIVDLAIEEMSQGDRALERVLRNQARALVVAKVEDEEIARQIREGAT